MMLEHERPDPEYARAIRDLRADVIDAVALEMLGATSADAIDAIRERLARGLPRLVAVEYFEVSRRHARRLESDPTQTLVLNGRRSRASKRRDSGSRAGRCVNENKSGTHGPATHGCRCEACHRTHRRTA